jgi:hypothetical protein
VPAVLSLSFFEHGGREDKLHLLDAFAIEKQFDGAQETFAAIDFDECSARVGGLTGRWGGENDYGKGCLVGAPA